MSLAMRVGDVGAGGKSTRICVLDDCDRGGIKVVGRAVRSICINVVVVGHLFAVKLFGLSDSWGSVWCYVEGSWLVGVLAVPQRGRALPNACNPPRETLTIGTRSNDCAHPRCNGDVIARGMTESLGRQRLALFEREAAALHCLNDLSVAVWRNNDRDRRMVLRSGTNHRWPTDVDLLDTLILISAARDSLTEGVEVDDHKFKRRDPVVLQLLDVVRQAGIREDASMHARVQRLDSAVEHFGELSEVGNLRHLDALITNRRSGRTGRDEFNSLRSEGCGKFNKPGLVIDRDQRATNWAGTHENTTSLPIT